MTSGFEYESDWKLFREKIADWQERYMEHLIEEYKNLLNEDKKASTRFWELEERIKADRRDTGVYISDIKRSNMTRHILDLLREGGIDMSDLDDFSDKFKDYLGDCRERNIL